MSIAVMAAFALLGAAVGVAHFVSLQRNVRLYLSAGRLRHAVALQALRLALTVALFAAAALQGAAPLLLAAGGFLLARTFVLARHQRAGALPPAAP